MPDAHGRMAKLLPSTGKRIQTKAATLAAAGISTSAAQRYEELARHPAVQETAEAYYVECKETGRPPTFGGLYARVKQSAATSAEAAFSPIIQPDDTWNFSRVVYGRIDGEDGHGYIPGDLYANCLFYYTNPGDVVAAPMAGAGQIMRVYENRAVWARPEPWDLDIRMFDLSPRGPYEHVIPTPADQHGFVGLGHQWKSVCGWMVLASRRRQRSATVAWSASSVAKCVLTTASSTSGQRCSAGCSSGV